MTIRDEDRRYNKYPRSGSPPSRENRGTYRDRDREAYRSPSYDSRSRSRSRRPRSRSRSQQRDRSPYYGGPASREVILEGLILDMVEEDVGLPTHESKPHDSYTFIPPPQRA